MVDAYNIHWHTQNSQGVVGFTRCDAVHNVHSTGVKGYDYMQCVNGLSVLWILPAGSGNWRQLGNDVWLSHHYQDINVTLSQWLCLCV